MTDETGGKPLEPTHLVVSIAALTELLAAAEECAGDLASKIESDFCPDSHSSTDQFVYEMRRVNRLRAAVERVRGE